MKLSVQDAEIDNTNKILIRLTGEDLRFLASHSALSIYVDEDMADKISFQLSSLLQDHYYKKHGEPK